MTYYLAKQDASASNESFSFTLKNTFYMPELELVFGYPMVLCLIVISAILPLYIY